MQAQATKYRHFLPHLVLISGLAVTIIFAYVNEKGTRERNRLRFDREVDNAQAIIQSRFELYVAVLRGGAGLFAADDDVDREGFRWFIRRLDLARHYPGAQGIGFSLRVGQTPALPDWVPSEIRVWPASPRSEYHSIVFLEPLDRRNQAALGYDMYSEPTRREAMSRACDTASAAASGKVTLVQEIDQRKQAGFLIFVPVYRSAEVPQTVAERRRLLHGFVYAPFRLEDAFHAIIPEDYERVLHIDVFDGEATDALHRLYRSEGPVGDTYLTTRRIEQAGRVWTIRYAARPLFEEQTERSQIGWIVFIGVGASMALFWAARSEAAARKKAERAAMALSQRTEELVIAYEEANRSEQHYREIVETTQEGIWTCDAAALTTFANEATARLVGQDVDDLIGHSVFDYVDEETAATIRQKLANHGQCGERYELRLGRRDGTAVRVRVSATPLRNTDGTYAGTLAMLTDITSQRIAEEQRDELNRRLEGVLESMGEGLIAFDQNLACTLMNQSAARLLGMHADAAVGRQAHDLLHGTGEENHRCDLTNAQLPTAGEWRDGVFVASGGTSFSAEYVVSPIMANGVTVGFVLTFRDVTEQRFLRKQLEQAQRLSSLGRLAASMAHEFNNVLMVVQPFAELIARPRATAADLVRAHAQITAAIQRGKRSTEEILTFTRDATPRLQPIDVRTYLERLLSHLRPSMPGVALEVEMPQAGLCIAGDATQLEQVFTNLLLNARDAKATRIVISAEECVSGRTAFPFGTISTPDRFVHFGVADDGVGMSADVLERIFEPLFTTKQSGGTGLGLPIAQQIILKHGGTIAARSTPGRGTHFDLLLPREIAPATIEPGHERPSPIPARVLIVDDEPNIVEGITALLELEGNQVRTVANGAATLPAIEEFDPDVVVLDVGLPDVDGRELYASIQKRWPDLAVIFSTGHATVPASDRGYFLRKPYEFTELLAAMAAVRPESTVSESSRR